MYNKQKLINAVIKDLKKGFALGDYTVLNELLGFIPDKNLLQALPEEQWKKHKVPEPYFNIVAQGYDESLEREQVEIKINGDSGKVFLIKSDCGFIVDVYSPVEGEEDELVNTMAIFDDDLEQEEIEELQS
jgi:hypothetical protein